jgi:F-type H+-transporting ATPase subunit delta
MTENAHYSPAAASYAQALLELAEAKNQIEPVGQELAGLAQVVRGNRAFRLFLADPAIGETERADFLKRVLGANVSPLVMHTLLVMNRKGRSALLGEVIEAYAALMNEKLGRVEVNVTVAKALDEKQLSEVGRRVGEALGKQAIVKQSVDESIIGGLVLRVRDRLIDASVKSQLRTIRRKLAGGV